MVVRKTSRGQDCTALGGTIGSEKCVQLLVEKGADVDAKDDVGTNTPRHSCTSA